MSQTEARVVVSFVEKQLELTQKRHAEVEASLADIMSAIEDNARLQMTLHDLTLDVMRTPSLEDALQLLVFELKHRFALKDVQLWGMTGSALPKAVPTETMNNFLAHMSVHVCETGLQHRFPMEVWGCPGIVSGCAFRLYGRCGAFGVLLLGRADDGFDGQVDTLFLQQFVNVMGFWLEEKGGAGNLAL